MSNFFIETANNVQINMNSASVGHRLVAYVIDSVFLLLFVILVVISMGMIDNGGFSDILIMILVLFPMFFYHLLMEVFNKGRSLGKMIMKLQVVREDGQSPTIGNYLLRWLLRPIDNFFYGSVAIITIVVSKKGQRLGDMAAGTMVVRHKQEVTLNELTQFFENDSYVPTYNNVTLLTQEQINTIKEVLIRYKKSGDLSKVIVLGAKVKNILKVENTDGDYKFLYTVVKDYENYMK